MKRYIHYLYVILAAACWGETLGVTPKGTASRIRAVLKGYELMTDIPDGLSPDSLTASMALDKKAEGAKVRTVLLSQIGQCTGVPLTPSQLRDLL